MAAGHDHAPPDELVALGDQRREVLERVRPLDPIELSVLEAHGCVLAEDIVAREDVPGFANAAMDGYAVRADAVADGAELRVVGEVAAGTSPQRALAPGEAMEIMTGAPLPPGADAVVPVEQARRAGESVVIDHAPRQGAHVRAAGESARAGEPVLSAGRLLRAADVGLLAATGHAFVRAHPRPRVAVFSTGDELVEPGHHLAHGQIRDANSYSLTAAAREAGAVSHRQLFVRDDRAALERAFDEALGTVDMLVTSGGVSAGKHDLVKQVLAKMGDVTFRKVAVKPGMPQAFGFVRDVPCFALPGNPVSALVSFELFVRPAIRRLQGREDLDRSRLRVVLDEALDSSPHRVEMVRVRLRRAADGWRAAPTGEQGSAILRSMVDADALAEVPAGRGRVEAGEALVAHLLVDPT